MATTYGERLKAALEYRRMSQRAFARSIKEQGIRGGSYRSLANYLTDVFTPTQIWTQAAAELLGVSETWLANDDGQMLPEEEPTDPNLMAVVNALDLVRSNLSKTAHYIMIQHLLLACHRFEDVYGETRGMSGPKAKQHYANHLILPLTTLVHHIRGSHKLTGVEPETVRQALNHYVELVLLLMPTPEEVSDEEKKAVSRCMSEWRKGVDDSKAFKPGKIPDATEVKAMLQHLKANPENEE